jgi:hypothetical protein
VDTEWGRAMGDSRATERADRSVITKHLNNVFASGELERESNVQKMHIAGADRPVAFYALDAIISIGYQRTSLV